MTSTPSLRRALLVPLALATLLATAGCVNLPANTTATVIGNPAKAGSGADVRIWPQAPQRDAPPEQIVEDFVQTAASDPSNYSIARDYLIGGALTNWHQDRVVVFSEVSSPKLESGDPAGHGPLQVTISGTMVATVSPEGAYQQVPNPKDTSYTFNLSYDQSKGYYRIDKLPNDDFGILLTQETFRANYAAYYLYYLNQDAPTTSMIPVPDYQRSQAGDAVTAQNLVSALFMGPPDALTGVGVLAAPDVALAGPVTISPDDTASVPIKTPSNCATSGKSACTLLADELLATFSTLASVSQVMLVDAQGNPLVSSSPVDSLAGRYHIGASAAKSTSFYFLDSKNHQVSRYDAAGAGASSSITTEQVGPDSRKYSQVAVGSNASQTYVAAVDDKGSKLYVSTPGSAKDTAPIYTGHRITSLTWDAFGHLWFLDFIGTTATLYRLDMTSDPPTTAQQVMFDGEGGPINESSVYGIAAAPDGRRIAVSYTEAQPTGPPLESVAIGLVEDTGAGLDLNTSFGTAKPVVDHWSSVSDVRWHGSQALAVLGSASATSPPTVSELNSDGSPVISAADLNPVTVNPPTGTIGIEWTGSALLAAMHSGSGSTAVQQVEQYQFANGQWIVDANSGFSPTYAN